MADDGVVISTPSDAQDVLVVSVAGETLDAVTIAGALYTPSAGDQVTTIPLSDGRVLLLVPS